MTEVLDKNTIKALSVEQRQAIMKMLARRPYTASEIAKVTGRHVTTITQHLDVLEGSGLVRKKDSTNKWVYYTLTDRGERLFKPQSYSWIVVLSLSIVLVSIGMLRIFSPADYGLMARSEPLIEKYLPPAEPARTAEALYGATLPANTTNETAQIQEQTAEQALPPAPGPDYVAFALIALGTFGMAYIAYGKIRLK
jgi:DNA-binding transcriptional ArsR family regulator